MSTESQAGNDNSELGITFVTTPARGSADASGSAPSVPTPEEIARDSEESKRSGVFDVSKAFEAKHELGTIVTDKKHAKPSLGDNLQSAFHEWWGGVKKTTAPALESIKSPKPKKSEEANVPKAETRATVIETAATHAAMAPKDDHRVVIEKVKTFRRDVERVTGTPFTVKEAPKKAGESAPQWTHTVDEKKTPEPRPTPTLPKAQPDLRQTMVAPVVEKRIEKDITDFYKKELPKKEAVIPRKATAPNQIAYMHIPSTVEKRPDPIVRARAPVAPVVREEAPAVPTETVLQTPREEMGYVAKSRETLVKPLREGPAEGVPMPETPSQKAEEQPEISAFHTGVSEEPRRGGEVERAPRTTEPLLSPRARTILFWSAVPSAAVLGIVLAVIVSVSGTPPDTPPSERETVSLTPAKILDVDSQTPLPLASGMNVLKALAGLVGTAPSGVHQFYPTVADGAGTRALSAEDFFMNLRTQLPESAVRSLDDAFTVGSITLGKNEPFMLLRARNFDALFAGMLAWEPRMRQDLSPLFDDTYVEEDFFDDAVRANRPVRILYDALGNEAIVYAFVDKNTLVITSSSDALARVIEKL